MNTLGLLQSEVKPEGLTVLLECKMEKQNSQCEQGQPMEQTRSFFRTCNLGVARCQSQHQFHFWRMNSMLGIALHGQVSLATVSQICVNHEVMNN